MLGKPEIALTILMLITQNLARLSSWLQHNVDYNCIIILYARQSIFICIDDILEVILRIITTCSSYGYRCDPRIAPTVKVLILAYFSLSILQAHYERIQARRLQVLPREHRNGIRMLRIVTHLVKQAFREILDY